MKRLINLLVAGLCAGGLAAPSMAQMTQTQAASYRSQLRSQGQTNGINSWMQYVVGQGSLSPADPNLYLDFSQMYQIPLTWVPEAQDLEPSGQGTSSSDPRQRPIRTDIYWNNYWKFKDGSTTDGTSALVDWQTGGGSNTTPTLSPIDPSFADLLNGVATIDLYADKPGQPAQVQYLSIYAGYDPHRGVVITVTTPDLQVAGPSSVLTQPSTQLMIPSTQILIPSTQIAGPSSILSSLDLQPALCGH